MTPRLNFPIDKVTSKASSKTVIPDILFTVIGLRASNFLQISGSNRIKDTAKSRCIKEAVAHVSSIAFVLRVPNVTSTAGHPTVQSDSAPVSIQVGPKGSFFFGDFDVDFISGCNFQQLSYLWPGFLQWEHGRNSGCNIQQPSIPWPGFLQWLQVVFNFFGDRWVGLGSTDLVFPLGLISCVTVTIAVALDAASTDAL